jgi:Protein  of unknown function (DUF3018)
MTSTRRPKTPRKTLPERPESATPIEVPDVQAPALRAEAYRQSQAVGRSPSERADQAFIDAVSVPSDE